MRRTLTATCGRSTCPQSKGYGPRARREPCTPPVLRTVRVNSQDLSKNGYFSDRISLLSLYGHLYRAEAASDIGGCRPAPCPMDEAPTLTVVRREDGRSDHVGLAPSWHSSSCCPSARAEEGVETVNVAIVAPKVDEPVPLLRGMWFVASVTRGRTLRRVHRLSQLPPCIQVGVHRALAMIHRNTHNRGIHRRFPPVFRFHAVFSGFIGIPTTGEEKTAPPALNRQISSPAAPMHTTSPDTAATTTRFDDETHGEANTGESSLLLHPEPPPPPGMAELTTLPLVVHCHWDV